MDTYINPGQLHNNEMTLNMGEIDLFMAQPNAAKGDYCVPALYRTSVGIFQFIEVETI